MLGAGTVVENYVTEVMGCQPLTSSTSTIRSYYVQEGLHMNLRYYYPTGGDDHMFIGEVEWLYLGYPGKKELFNSDMPTEALCRYLVMRVLDYSFK